MSKFPIACEMLSTHLSYIVKVLAIRATMVQELGNLVTLAKVQLHLHTTNARRFSHMGLRPIVLCISQRHVIAITACKPYV